MKKVALGLGITFLVGAVIFGVGNMIGMLKVGGQKISDYATSQVPISAKIELMEQKLKELGPQIEDAQRVVATQEIRVNKLRTEVNDKKVALQGDLDDIYAMRDDLARNEKQYVYAGQTFSADEVKSDLQKKLDRYKAAKEALDHQENLLVARNNTYKANQKKLENLENAQHVLKTKIEELRARYETLKAQEIEEMQTVDGAPTEDIQKLYEEIDEQLAVEEKLNEMDSHVGEIEVNKAEQKDLLEEIDAMRNKDAADGKNNELIKTEKEL